MHSGGSMTGGSVSSRSVNFFSRERELKELTEKLSSGQAELEKLLNAMHDGQQEKDERFRAGKEIKGVTCCEEHHPSPSCRCDVIDAYCYQCKY